MIKHPIQVRRAGFGGPGYRVLVSRRPPRAVRGKKACDAWISSLAPSQPLWESYLSGACPWPAFVAGYRWELQGTAAQDTIKPLALLSLRRPVVLLCDCSCGSLCPTQVLAEVLAECRRSGRFVLSFCGPETAAGAAVRGTSRCG